MPKTPLPLAVLALSLVAATARAQEKGAQPAPSLLDARTLKGLALRGIGPALMGGRIADVAIHPKKPRTWYVAVGSGGVWKTTNAGTTWTPIFDDQPSYSIGCVTIDPNAPDTIWVGTGENVSGRHVAHGTGVFRSRDGGASFARAGLPRSEHISRIVVDPRDSDVVYVAAEGPLWAAGGERGLYKTTDGGTSWQRALFVDDDTGVTDVQLDPRDPDVLYAATYQRRRHTWSLLAGGPGSRIYKSTNGGKAWERLTRGLPKGDAGKIGLAVSPVDPDVVYATIEADEEERGFYRSRDRGASWSKRNSYISGGTGPHYYQEIVASPHDVDVVYQMDVFIHVTRDGGASFEVLGDGRQKHSDNHALHIDPKDPRHLIAGTDASLYESFDDGATWRQVPNLPVGQFYRVAVDDRSPFWSLVGGAQDQGTLIGPSRTRNTEGVRNQDWYVPLGADGYGVAFEPGNPDIVYMEIQEGELCRYDRVSHEFADIKPQGAPGDAPDRYNWDAPLLVSPHSPARIYFGSQRLWRSDDRGDSWQAISGDLTRGDGRYAQKLFGRVWSVDALHDTRAMSKYATTTTISESPRVAGLLYVGTDDGRIQVTEDGGGAWRAAGTPPGGVAERIYVNEVMACRHDADTVFAALDAHKLGDFRPFLFESRDRGRTWRSIAGDLPQDAYVWALAQDHEVADLLFAGTEKGLYFTPDRGRRWIRLAGGMPTISVRDIAIQRRDDDLVAATFGRGFFVLDDYGPLRAISRDAAAESARLFGVRDAWSYVPYEPMQARGQPSLGSTAYSAPNPPFGAVLAYYLPATPKTGKEARHAREAALRKERGDVPFPGWDALAAEALEQKPFVLLTVKDAAGTPIRRLRAPAKAGLHRVAWDLRGPIPDPTVLERPKFRPPWAGDPVGPLVAPGRYRVEAALVTGAGVQAFGSPQEFEVRTVPGAAVPHGDLAADAKFRTETAELLRRALGTRKELGRVQDWLKHVRPALVAAPRAGADLFARLAGIERTLAGLSRRLDGDPVRGRLNEAATPSILGRIQRVASRHWQTRQAATSTQIRSLGIARAAYTKILGEVGTLLDTEVPGFESALEKAGATWTPLRRSR